MTEHMTRTTRLDLVAGPTSTTPPQTCIAARLVDTLNDSDRRALTRALNNRDVWPADILARELYRNGHVVSASSIRNHRNNVCICHRQDPQ